MLSRMFVAALWSPERKGLVLLALVCDVYCDFVNFSFGILGQVWYLIVSIPDPCCLSYFYNVLYFLSIRTLFLCKAAYTGSLRNDRLVWSACISNATTCKYMPGPFSRGRVNSN